MDRRSLHAREPARHFGLGDQRSEKTARKIQRSTAFYSHRLRAHHARAGCLARREHPRRELPAVDRSERSSWLDCCGAGKPCDAISPEVRWQGATLVRKARATKSRHDRRETTKTSKAQAVAIHLANTGAAGNEKLLLKLTDLIRDRRACPGHQAFEYPFSDIDETVIQTIYRRLRPYDERGATNGALFFAR